MSSQLSQPRRSTAPGEPAGACAGEPHPDTVVRVGWKVAGGYDRLPVERLLATRDGVPVAYVRYVVLPAPAWCKR